MKFYMIFITSFYLLFFSGCYTKEILPESIGDLTQIEQQPYLYGNSDMYISKDKQTDFYKDYLRQYFKPWNIDKISYSLDVATWAFEYKDKKVYAENHRLVDKNSFETLISNSNFEQYNNLAKKGITVRNTNLRALPMDGVIFYNPSRAGEGFPFDYNQNSSIKINTPLFISHFSKDRLWVFVESSVALGWVKIQDIAFVDEQFIQEFQTGDYYINTKDKSGIYTKGYIQDSIELGTIFPKNIKGFLMATKDYSHKAIVSYIDDNYNLKQMPLEFNIKNIELISSELIGQKYGWGGLYGHRDCSAMTKDFYAPFGIFLQRNSGDQKNDGIYMDIKKMDRKSKKQYILDNGIPWTTLVYMKGHIMIYIGSKNGEPLVFHNVWGIRTLQDDGSVGRFVVGQAVVTTLEMGKDLPNVVKDSLLIDRVEGITLIAVQ